MSQLRATLRAHRNIGNAYDVDFTLSSLQSLIDSAVPEGQTLEFKQSHDLNDRRQKGELLKDLTGMANGGGGTIIYGIREDDEERNSAVEMVPLVDRTLPGRIEQIVRAGVSPPLIYRLTEVEGPGGFLVTVDVTPSQLGPYMVTLYDRTENRYFKRHGRNVLMMSEQEVRDAYALAVRATERRPAVWAEHSLPLPIGDSGVLVSVIPLEPLGEMFDLRTFVERDLIPPASLLNFMGQACDIGRAINLANRWADGFVGQTEMSMIRLHRDGSAGMFQAIGETTTMLIVARIVDAMLAYLGWLYVELDLRRPIEVRMEVAGLDVVGLIGQGIVRQRRIAEAPGVSSTSVRLDREVEPQQLAHAPVRHAMVRTLADRFVQAYGLDRTEAPFNCGPLYGPDHKATQLELQPGLMHIWGPNGLGLGTLDPSGVVRASSSGRIVGYWDSGVVIDLKGDTLGVVELAVGQGCPSGYFPQDRELHDVKEHRASTPLDATSIFTGCTLSGRWSNLRLRTVLEDVEGLTGTQI